MATSPLLTALPLLLLPAVWLGLFGLGLDHVPRGLVDLLAIPPIGSFFDLNFGVTIYGVSSAALVYAFVATVVRSVVWAVLAGMIVESLEEGRATLRGAGLGVRSLHAVFLANLLALVLVFVGQLILPSFLGPSIGYLGFTVALVGGVYFLVFAPAAAIREELSPRAAVRRSAQAARLPGARHLTMVFLYFILALPVLFGFTPGGDRVTANPSFLLWVYVLVGTLLHLVFFAAFSYRYLAVEKDPQMRQAAAALRR